MRITQSNRCPNLLSTEYDGLISDTCHFWISKRKSFSTSFRFWRRYEGLCPPSLTILLFLNFRLLTDYVSLCQKKTWLRELDNYSFMITYSMLTRHSRSFDEITVSWNSSCDLLMTRHKCVKYPPYHVIDELWNVTFFRTSVQIIEDVVSVAYSLDLSLFFVCVKLT